jgi:phage major head subunit gpT-like protein
MRKWKTIKAAAASPAKIIAMSAPVTIAAAEGEAADGPKTFTSTFYTGGAMTLAGWDLPVVIDLAGLKPGNVLVANLDHDQTKRVGNFSAVNDGKSLVAIGKATAATAARDEVVNSAQAGYQWQASLEVNPTKVETLAKGKTATVNGQVVTGPAYITRTGTLKGFGFVSHGADDNTTATIAAAAAPTEKNEMDPKLKAWIEAMGFDVEAISADQLAGLTANYNGQNGKKPVPEIKAGFEAVRAERERVDGITQYALSKCEQQPRNIDAIKILAEQAIDAKWTLDKFRMELLEASTPEASSPWTSRPDERLNNRILEAAVCMTGRLGDDDSLVKMFGADTLQQAHERFPQGIALNQLIMIGAQANGYRNGHSSKVTVEAQRAAFGMSTPAQMRASGFSTVSIPNVVSNVANKFLRQGWDAVDMTPLRVAAIRSVTDFKTITTVSLIGDTEFQKVGSGGEIAHGKLGEEVYTNKADTYARMLAITRTDYINDDLGALTSTPKKLGRGGGLMLNKIFWTKFLNNSAFFTSGRSNVNTAVADMTQGGLDATNTIFVSQTDANGDPVGTAPKILLVPTALETKARTLMSSEKLKGDTNEPEDNPWRGRFRVESSPYMHNTAYTGYSAAAWYMLADPADLPVIEIVALNGRVEPTVETADADFNVLGVQMRGYSDVGVELQEYRGGVRADGGSS